jgi:uncharacterized protein (DUF952 family)
MLIFKILHRAEWIAAEKAGRYDGSAKDREDGFLHFSTAGQLMGTLEKHYAGADDLILVAVEDDTLGPALKWEAARGGALFPHLYAPLSITHVRWSADIERDAQGHFLLPPDIGESP